MLIMTSNIGRSPVKKKEIDEDAWMGRKGSRAYNRIQRIIKAQELKKSGMSVQEIGKQLKINYGTAWRYLQEDIGID